MTDLVELRDVRAAAERIATQIRRTPLLDIGPVKTEPGAGAGTDWQLRLKLEQLQVTGSFKARGAANKVAMLAPADLARGICTASGGNHGLAVAYVGWDAGVPATIYVPESTPAAKRDKLAAWDAEVVVHGAAWDDANTEARAVAKQRGLTYIHPFADPAVIAGQGTIALEVLADAPGTDTIMVAIGGGGLISGVAAAAKALRPGIRIVGVEPTGAPTLYRSVQAGQLVTLDEITTDAVTLAPRRSMPINLDLIRSHVDRLVQVSDDEMRAAARWLWFELGIAAELSGAAALAALMAGRRRPAAGETVVALICGAGTDGLS